MVPPESEQNSRLQAEESTLILIKPDAVARRLTGILLAAYEGAGLDIRGLKLMKPDPALLRQHYAEHAGKCFMPELLNFMQEGAVVAAILSGPEAVAHVRRINGATDPAQAEKGTIRNLYGATTQRNCVHGSATPADALREIALWFPESVLHEEGVTV